MRKPRWYPTPGSSLARGLAVSVVLAGAAGYSVAGDIKLDNGQIPPSPQALNRFKLSRASVPNAIVNKVVSNISAGLKFEPLATSAFAQSHGIRASNSIEVVVYKDHVVAAVDPTKGHVDVMPLLDGMAPLAPATTSSFPALSQAVADQARKSAMDVLTQGLFPADATKPVLDKMLTLNAAEFNQGSKGAPATMNVGKSGPVMASFPVMRMVNDLQVYGQGSRGMISVGGGGKVAGLSRHWQVASQHDQVSETRTPAQIGDLIRAQLAGLAAKGDVTVQEVKVGYYDGDNGFIQPVYQFKAQVSYTPPAGAKVEADDDYVAGYVVIGPELEPVPSVNDKVDPPPGVPQGAPTNLPLASLMPTDPPGMMDGQAPTQIAEVIAAPGDPTVGRYVVRNDNAGWVNSANGFWNGLMSSGYGGYFTNSQYFWAYPFEFYGSKNSYTNAVNVSLVEVHGDWYLWTTYQNWGDLVYLDSIPAPGYGMGTGGKCNYLIIHSCEVVPSAADTGSWAAKWWHVFGGLHTVFGYRTIMYINDGTTTPFGRHMGLGFSLVSAWLSDVASSSMYWGHPGAVMHGSWKPYGRPSTISVCGHEGDSVYNQASLPAAGCLRNYWYY